MLEPIKISKDDEAKFRFLKKYFAEQGNHFKEQQYFSYEMMAREQGLEVEGGSDLFLFKCYKWFSDFGMSVGLPFAWMCMSFAVFFNIFVFEFGWDLPTALTRSFVRTINPLTKFDGEITADTLSVFLTLQSLINAALIFLFILGLRNKLKIK